MVTDYKKLTKDNIEQRLREAGVTPNPRDKKADMLAQLMAIYKNGEGEGEDGAPASDAAAPTTTEPSTAPDPPAPAADPPAATAPSAAEPAAAPVADTAAAPAATDPTTTDTAPAKDFAAHLPNTSYTDELARRKARAARFGLEGVEEADKELTRAKRFGLEAGEQTQAVGGLDAGLPEEGRRGRKGGDGRGPAGNKDKVRDGRVGKKTGRAGTPTGAPSEADRAKAEARAKRFGNAG